MYLTEIETKSPKFRQQEKQRKLMHKRQFFLKYPMTEYQ